MYEHKYNSPLPLPLSYIHVCSSLTFPSPDHENGISQKHP